MEKELLIGLAGILVLGTLAQWVAWRLRLPSILLLLLAGVVAGPATGLLDPDMLLGDLLFPVVSLSVAIILFEGGLTLDIESLRRDGATIWKVVLLGALVTWALATPAAYFLLDFNFGLSLLIGAILIVTGPTVVTPLLLFIRPIGRVGAVARWEGIVNDPIGAVVAVLVFEVLHLGIRHPSGFALLVLLKGFGAGALIGVLGAILLVFLLRRYWLPDVLQEPVVLTVALGGFVLANTIQPEAGLVTVTILGIVLANQNRVAVHHIVEFKERLRVILIAGLFVLLAARLDMEAVSRIDLGSVLFLAALVFVVRPAAVAVSTIGSKLNWRERVFLAWMAPRGIVAAAVSSVFGLELARTGYPGAESLMPEVFFVIVGTVFLYGTTAAPLARWLKLADQSPQGFLFVGAHEWARRIAAAVQNEGFAAVLVDTNRQNVAAARMEGLIAIRDDAVSPHVEEEVGLRSVGRLLAVTPNHAANSLAVLHYIPVFGRSEVYQLPPPGRDAEKLPKDEPLHLQGRTAFSNAASFEWFSRRFREGAVVKSVRLTEQFGIEDFREHYGDGAQPLFVVFPKERRIEPFAPGDEPEIGPNCRIVAVVDDPDDPSHRRKGGAGHGG